MSLWTFPLVFGMQDRVGMWQVPSHSSADKSGASVDAAVARGEIELPHRNLPDGHGRHGGFNRPSQNNCRATQRRR